LSGTRFSPKYKTRILAEYEALDRSERGVLLCREGLEGIAPELFANKLDPNAERANPASWHGHRR
jgi:hypothetical protein